jgi:hypothetical protein
MPSPGPSAPFRDAYPGGNESNLMCVQLYSMA